MRTTFTNGQHVRVKVTGDIHPGDEPFRGCTGKVDAALTGLGRCPFVAIRPDDPEDAGTFGILLFHPESVEPIQ